MVCQETTPQSIVLQCYLGIVLLEVETQIGLLPDSIHVHREWRKMLVDYGISGVQVHDARLVAAMRVHGVKRILTFNARDFRRFTDVDAVLPENVIAGG
jgi:predicted nucleic acid-binding protein